MIVDKAVESEEKQKGRRDVQLYSIFKHEEEHEDEHQGGAKTSGNECS